VGGNNAIMNADVLNMPVRSSAEALGALAEASEVFDECYRRVITTCNQTSLPLTLCTIYNGCFPDAHYQRLISAALMVFDDVILRVAIELHLPTIDLRFVCSAKADYANPIGPSCYGGAKIARAIVILIALPQDHRAAARIVVG
jgi:hypothetical protein